jgi:hypothetical protein
MMRKSQHISTLNRDVILSLSQISAAISAAGSGGLMIRNNFFVPVIMLLLIKMVWLYPVLLLVL